MSAPDDADPAGELDYDPVKQSPRTLGQLERWFDHVDRRRNDRNLPLAASLGYQENGAIDRLCAYSGAKYGEPGPWLLSLANIRRVTSQYALDRGVSMNEAKATPLQEVADFLAPIRGAKSGQGKAKRPSHKAKTEKQKAASTRRKRTKVRPVELHGRGEPPTVRGKRKDRPLTASQYDVVGLLLTAGEKGLTKDELASMSKHADARGILRRLADSDPDWRAVIKFPGKPGVRYRIG